MQSDEWVVNCGPYPGVADESVHGQLCCVSFILGRFIQGREPFSSACWDYFWGIFFYCFAIDKSELESAKYQQLCMRFVCGIEVVDFKKAEVGIKVGVGNVNKSYLT